MEFCKKEGKVSQGTGFFRKAWATCHPDSPGPVALAGDGLPRHPPIPVIRQKGEKKGGETFSFDFNRNDIRHQQQQHPRIVAFERAASCSTAEAAEGYAVWRTGSENSVNLVMAYTIILQRIALLVALASHSPTREDSHNNDSIDGGTYRHRIDSRARRV